MVGSDEVRQYINALPIGILFVVAVNVGCKRSGCCINYYYEMETMCRSIVVLLYGFQRQDASRRPASRSSYENSTKLTSREISSIINDSVFCEDKSICVTSQLQCTINDYILFAGFLELVSDTYSHSY